MVRKRNRRNTKIDDVVEMSEKLERLDVKRKFTSEAKELKTLTIAEASYLAGLIDETVQYL